MLAFWEKNTIPKIIEFVKSTYKPWEMRYYFEQLRFHLRNADHEKAVAETTIMVEKNLTNYNIPDDNHDWTAKMPEECIVGTWATVKLIFNS